MENAAVNLNSNVRVKYIDRYGKVIRESAKHNKATVNLVDGILRFLRGDFSTTIYNQGSITPDEAEVYIPVRAALGRIGVKISDESQQTKDRRFSYIDRDDFVTPTFDSHELQEEVTFNNDTDYTLLKFRKIHQVGASDNNNSECLEFILYLNPGKLVGYKRDVIDSKTKVTRTEFVPYDWSYYNPQTDEYEAMFTEVGLFSSSNVLLARVLFDGKVGTSEYFDDQGVSHGKYPVFEDPNSEDNPIIQSESTTVVLTWRIGITSVGKNDTLVTQNTITTSQFSRALSAWFVEYLTSAFSSYNWNLGYSESRMFVDVTEEISKLLNGEDLSQLIKEE